MTDRRNLLQESLVAIERLEARLAASERAKHEPIAIIGAGCRYPGGANTPEELWGLLRDGRYVVSEVPPDRWDADAFYDPDPKAPGKMITKRGGFLSQIDHFDPSHFGISPREAATLDPQQRLLLEVSTEALESAGVPIDQLAGSSTGVFVGITTTDFAEVLRDGGHTLTEIYSGTGSALNAAAGRISFTYGLQGPCTAVDTACSSSLVAVHLACQSLRAGESNLALAGGVNVILSPDSMVLISKWGMLAPDGACKTFSAAANGFVRAEGCAVIALKRLSDALAANDPILGVIRGSASNSDGRSSGLTVPNGPAQQAVLRKALANAQLAPSDIDYVEAHGTGTSLGDPIEVEALGAVMGQGRPAERPLYIGSIKTNIGHAEAASGLAGLMKVLMSLRHEAIPPHLHFDEPNPRIPWTDLPVAVPTKMTPWPRGERPRRAGVSSFGFSGTNAHVILEEAPLRAPAPEVKPGTAFIVPLSAREESGLRDVAQRYADFIAEKKPSLADIATTASTGRAHLLRRIALISDSTEDLERDLRAVAAGETPAGAAHGIARPGERPTIAFLFTGQGSQYAGMGRGLFDTEPVFRAALERSAAILEPHLERPLLDVLFSSDPEVGRLINQTGYTQPALFALEYALAELWASWGITPSIVIGHSVGEYVAACVAGAFSLEDGLSLIAERARLMQALPAGGAMAAVLADEARVTSRLASMADRLSIAAVNGPEETVVSGDAKALDELLRSFAADGIKTRKLDVSHAFHSQLLDPMLDALERRAETITHAAPRIPLVSNITGKPWAPGARPDAKYWRRHAREAVRFAAGVDALRAAGVTALVEVGPQPILLALAGRSAPNATWTSVASLRRDRVERREMLNGLASLYANGAPVRWESLAQGRRLPLPTYPFRRERHWVSSKSSRKSGATPGGHPLLGQRQRSPQPGAQFLAEIGRDAPALLADHVVLGTVLVPGTAYIELGLAAARALGTKSAVTLQNFVIESPLALDATAGRLLHVAVEPPSAGRSSFVVRSAAVDAAADAEWPIHARASLREAASTALDPAMSVGQVRERCSTPVDVDAFYTRLAKIGLEYGPAFRLVRSLHVGTREAVGLLEAAPGEDGSAWVLHPAMLDSAFHLLGAALLAAQPEGAPDQVFLPVGIEEITVSAAVPSRVWATARVRDDAAAAAGVLVADLRLEDDSGNAVASVTGLQLRTVTADTLRRALSLPGIATHSYRVHWTPLEGEAPPPARAEGRVVVIGDRGGVAAALSRALSEQGRSCSVVSGEDSAQLSAEALTALFRGDRGSSLAWVVDCASLDAAAGNPPASARTDYLRVLAVAQAVAASSPRAGFCLVTRGAQAIAAGDEVDLARSALLGLARSAAAERADAPALRIDLDPAAPPDVRAIVRGLDGLAATEPEIGVRNGNLFVPRLEESVAARRDLTQRQVLRIRQRGALDALTIENEARRTPAAGEVEIAIRAAGLNFRDVLNTLGMYPGDAGALGSECSGIVTAVGPGVDHVAVGDEVVALAGDCIASHVTVSARLVVKKPESIGFAAAVTLPNTYLTAAQSFRTGGLRKGQRVLVHAATGGVGFAAMKLALRAGAEVIATAGSPEKRAFALAEGAAYAFDSRSTSFADEVLRVTGGTGVDVVLNSLSGELITAGMRVLRPGGCFLEIGKKDIWTPQQAKERAPEIRYEVVDLGEAIHEDAGAVRALFEELLRDVAAGELPSLPLRAFPLTEAVSAFRYMATARHIGKVVLVPDIATNDGALPVRADGTYLVTGGLGGLGFATAEWLAQRGAGEIVLLGRHGATAADEARLERVRANGARVSVVACDIGDRDAVRTLFRDVLPSRPRLRGIIHAAGVLADAPLGQQDVQKFDTAAQSKIAGVWHLHEHASNTPLDFFALYSSSSALLGSPGQANYAAANAFLDGFAAYRRARGQSATSIAWGAWAEVGMAARLSEAHRSRWAELGMGALDPGDALAAFERSLLRQEPYVAIAALDPRRIASHATPAVRALLGVNASATKEMSAAAAGPDALAALRAARDATPAERRALLAPYVHREAARVLGFNASALDVEAPLSALGFDSLMAVQLKNRVESDLAVEIPLAKFLTSPTVAKLIDEIGARLESGGATNTTAAASDDPGTAWEEGSL